MAWPVTDFIVSIQPVAMNERSALTVSCCYQEDLLFTVTRITRNSTRCFEWLYLTDNVNEAISAAVNFISTPFHKRPGHWGGYEYEELGFCSTIRQVGPRRARQKSLITGERTTARRLSQNDLTTSPSLTAPVISASVQRTRVIIRRSRHITSRRAFRKLDK